MQHVANRESHYRMYKGIKYYSLVSIFFFFFFFFHVLTHNLFYSRIDYNHPPNVGLAIAISDPETILKEVYSKTPCKRFMTVGDCAFGYGCRFSHYTPQMIWELEQLAATRTSKAATAQPRDGWPDSEDVIREYLEHAAVSSGTEEKTPVWGPSPAVGRSYLPPSLQPVTPDKMMECHFSKWA
ncbi:hypothetical protein PUN28_010290 [Cardiocondyla obscurior]|uniref:C3H1-type domain-containing protein n=1 Tax=Cardiocondyla obscurior TaxID=286306 RepID=A0AAW2FPI3_9HYME